MKVFYAIAVALAVLVAAPAARVLAATGDYGDVCFPIDPDNPRIPRCHVGVCVDLDPNPITTRWTCVHCGDDGAPACVDPNGRTYCRDPEFRPDATTGLCSKPNVRGNQRQPNAPPPPRPEDCGQLGYPACTRPDGSRYCYVGAPRAGLCAQCGYLWQLCCPDTPLKDECHEGLCSKTSNLCEPDANDAAIRRIEDAIVDCRFADADRELANATVAADPRAPELTERLARARDRESKAVAAYNRGVARYRDGNASFTAGDVSAARDYYQRALVLFRRALQATGCTKRGEKYSKAVAVAEKNLQRTRDADAALAAIDACAFNKADDLIGRLPRSVRAWLAPKAKAARARDARTRKLYSSGAAAANKKGNDLLAQGRGEQAKASYQTALDLLAQADSNNRCKKLQSKIDDAIAAVKRNIGRAGTIIQKPSPPRTPHAAYCIFKGKEHGREIGRRLIVYYTKEELAESIKKHCTTNQFNVSIEYKKTEPTTQAPSAPRTRHAAICIFKSKEHGREIGRRKIVYYTKDELATMIKKHCTTNQFNVSIEYE